MKLPHHWKNFVLPNVGYALLIWCAFYEGVPYLGGLVTALAWFFAASYGALLASPQQCMRISLNGLPVPRWQWHLADVSIASALLAAQAYWTAAGWILSAVIHHLIQIRGRTLLSRYRQEGSGGAEM